MKKILLFLVLAAFTFATQAQDCSRLFLSKYVEGYSNNRAIEIYNPTSQAVNLSGYSIGRFRNGSVSYDYMSLPSVMLQPYDTYLAVIDKRDSLGTCFEIPVWNGYQKWDVCLDGTTGLPIIDSDGDTVYCVQYQDVSCTDGNIPHHIYDNVYHDFLDLQGRADGFFNPVYVSGGSTPMYYNGDDAVALVQGNSIAPDGSNILDVIGVIGEDPGDAWATWNGYWITKDRTLVKRPEVKQGHLVAVGTPNDTIADIEWDFYPKNTFYVIDGTHPCACDPNYVSTKAVNQVDFKLYPNPVTNGHVMVEADAPIRAITVANIVGQLVLTKTYDRNNTREEVNLPNFDTGLYLMTIQFNDNSTTTRKLMIH